MEAQRVCAFSAALSDGKCLWVLYKEKENTVRVMEFIPPALRMIMAGWKSPKEWLEKRRKLRQSEERFHPAQGHPVHGVSVMRQEPERMPFSAVSPCFILTGQGVSTAEIRSAPRPRSRP